MNNEGLKKLKDIGAQKIYEQTHIPIEHVQAILHSSFEGLTKIHFLGFLSILQREYHVDLSQLREAGIAYYEEKNPAQEITEDVIFMAPKKREKFTIFSMLVLIFLFLAALFYTVDYSNQTNLTNNKQSIEDSKKNVNSIMVDANKSIADKNSSMDENTTLKSVAKIPSTPKVQKNIQKSFKIIARSKVWLGYIDEKTNKKNQKTFLGEFDLDPNKAWLLIFGHGYIDTITDGQKKKFNSKKTLRLLYKDGKVKIVTLDEFKLLNRGNAW